jgi:hypothetical protein
MMHSSHHAKTALEQLLERHALALAICLISCITFSCGNSTFTIHEGETSAIPLCTYSIGGKDKAYCAWGMALYKDNEQIFTQHYQVVFCPRAYKKLPQWGPVASHGCMGDETELAGMLVNEPKLLLWQENDYLQGNLEMRLQLTEQGAEFPLNHVFGLGSFYFDDGGFNDSLKALSETDTLECSSYRSPTSSIGSPLSTACILRLEFGNTPSGADFHSSITFKGSVKTDLEKLFGEGDYQLFVFHFSPGHRDSQIPEHPDAEVVLWKPSRTGNLEFHQNPDGSSHTIN